MTRRENLTELYKGESPRAHRFRYGLLVFDITAIAFVIATSFTNHGMTVEVIDALFGLVILVDFCARIWISTNRLKFLTRPFTIAEVAALISFLAPVAGEGLGFLRVLRTVRLLHSYQLMDRLAKDFAFFNRYRDITLATVNLMVFIFVMTGLIYAFQHATNPEINNYADALYFTVTTLTTTGFGDITPAGTSGRMLSVTVMIFGTTLFLRLVQVLLRPAKVRQPCPSCGLVLHDADAVHCKHCGRVIHIETEGQL